MKGLTSKDKLLLLPGFTFAEDQAILLKSVKQDSETELSLSSDESVDLDEEF